MPDLDNYKSLLISLRNELTKRSNAISKDLHHEDIAIEKDFAEQATQRENDEVLNSLDADARNKIMQIDKALLRIKNGEFGICEECGAHIDEKRLQAIPYASHCIACAS